MAELSDEDLAFSAFMEGAAGPDFSAQLEAAAIDEAKPGDDTMMVVAEAVTIGELRVLREAFVHVQDHACSWGAQVLVAWAWLTVKRVDPFLEWLDGADLRPHEEGDDGTDGSIQAGDDGGVEMGDEGDDVQDG